MGLGKVNRKELTLIADVLPMQYDLVIKRTLREAQGMLSANLPPARNLPDAQAVKSLRALVRTPQVHQALKRGNDTALCFALRAVNRILSVDWHSAANGAVLPPFRSGRPSCW